MTTQPPVEPEPATPPPALPQVPVPPLWILILLFGLFGLLVVVVLVALARRELDATGVALAIISLIGGLGGGVVLRTFSRGTGEK